MRKTRCGIWATMVTCLALTLVFGLVDPARATWYMVHGSGASIQDADDTAIVRSYSRKGTGLEIKLELGFSTQVHFAVPTIVSSERPVSYTARFVKVRVNMINDFCLCSGISEIQVYNGETLIKTFDAGWNTPGWQNITLDLGKLVSFSKGLGISVKIDTGPNGGYDSFIFSGAGANFVAP